MSALPFDRRPCSRCRLKANKRSRQGPRWGEPLPKPVVPTILLKDPVTEKHDHYGDHALEVVVATVFPPEIFCPNDSCQAYVLAGTNQCHICKAPIVWRTHGSSAR